MKKLYFLLFTFLITSSYGQMITEFEPNPAGTDPTDTTFELKGTPNAAFDLWIISIENDGYNGTVDRAANVTGNFDANGLAVVTTPDLENPSFTVVLSTAFTGSIGDDLDAADNGTIDTSSLGTILDAVGNSDSTADDTTLYGVTLGGANILHNGEFEPLLVFRDDNTGNWYNTVTINFGQPDEAVAVFDANGNSVDANIFDIDPTTGPTYGSTNPSTATAGTNDFNSINLKLFPNPTSIGFVNITSSNEEALNVQVFDILGKQVRNETLINNKLDVSNLKSGVYIVRITQNNASTTKKLVVK
ncbi:hypothetical protein FBALC1_01847 [Flavobacteriales bacterium ALC-1]|nr:hypothetical protein FBALC1_01847 [Flavobacteriales bacterium ALC-1]